jgi:DNA-binding NtrC family response regulator
MEQACAADLARTVGLTSIDLRPGRTPEADGFAFDAVSRAFGSLGRVCLALDSRFTIRHVSAKIDELLGDGTARRVCGRPVEELLGAGLFGSAGPLRQALELGERREGWRAWLDFGPERSRVVSVSAAPLVGPTGGCDASAVYIVVLRPADDDAAASGPGATTSYAGVIARAPSMLKVLRLVDNLQHSDATALLTGESGVGKGVIARAIHTSSARRSGPFVAVNCAALPDALLESELFGHVRGAFTGAIRDRVGRFELATAGTLFLDEIGDLPLHLQAKLLRVLQERTFDRVGDSRPITADVRIIAATHRDLRREVDAGRFRQDLFYRLRVVPIDIPPLRDRREDIDPLARFLLGQVCARAGRAVRFSPEALRVLLEHHWPGNVRELENALEFAVTVAQGQTLQPEDLPPEISKAPAAGPGSVATLVQAPNDAGKGAEAAAVLNPACRVPTPARGHLVARLDENHWRISETSRALGVSRTTLWRWMREMQIAR